MAKPITIKQFTFQIIFITSCITMVYAKAATIQKKITNNFTVQSSYKPLPREDLKIINANILVGNGQLINNGSIYIKSGKIIAIGEQLTTPSNIKIINAKGKWITPGLIDVHSHLGSYPTPDIASLSDTNEKYTYNTAGARIEDSIITQDAGFHFALEGGVTTLQILPGSHNVFGGLGVVLKNTSARTVAEMKFPNAPYSLKMACGENPKLSNKSQRPKTRMGVAFAMREEWIKAQAYADKWQYYQTKIANNEIAKKPERSLTFENLAGVLSGDISIQMHCYRAEEMAVMYNIAKEFDFKIAAFHHASEAYKIADMLTENDTCAVLFADWWGFKMEAFDAIPQAMAFVHAAGGCAVLHSDTTLTGQYLNKDLAIALRAGQQAGLNITPAQAISWLTLNAAKTLGLEQQIGSLEVGKNADLVIWSADPFSVYSKTEQVFIDGAIAYDRFDKSRQPRSDFELGQQLNSGVSP